MRFGILWLPRDRHCVKERLHRRLAKAPALMRPLLIVFADPQIEVGLQLVD
jgi:hypothetical protein